MRSRLLSCVTLCGVAAVAAASPVTFRAELHQARPVSYTIVLTPATVGAAREPIRHAGSSETPVRLDVPDGTWSVDVEGTQLFHPRQFITVAGERDVILDFWPSGTLAGTITTRTKPVPEELTIAFAAISDAQSPQRGETVCRIESAAFRCTLPAGTWQLGVRARGHISRYFEGITIAESQVRSLSAVELIEGQSISGRVALPRGVTTFTKVTIQAKPSGVLENLTPLAQGPGLLTRTVNAEKNGAFHFDGMMPGKYVLRASHPDHLISDAVEVPVRHGREVSLTEALELQPPRQLSVTIDPPFAPENQRWHVQLNRYMSSNHLDAVTESGASRDGTWSSPPLMDGRYELTVGTMGRDVWYRESFRLAAADERRHIQLSQRSAGGSVSLGGKPLEALLTFNDQAGRTFKFNSDSGGHFRGLIPATESGEWAVLVESKAPVVHRVLDGIRPNDGSDGEATFNIELPASLLTGNVVDEHGTPVAYAIIDMSRAGSAERFFQAFAESDGSFSLAGLASGNYTIAARTIGKESNPAEIDFKVEQASDPLELVVHDVHEIRGRVVSELGPVAGASVVVAPTDRPAIMMVPVTTEADGQFTVPVGNDVHEFDMFIAAPGFAYSADHVPVRSGVLVVTIKSGGGTLLLPASPDREQGYVLVRDGAILPVDLLVGGWPSSLEQTSDGMLLRIPMIEPGAYALCSVDTSNWTRFRQTHGTMGGRCSSGFLDPYGSLKLTAPEAQKTN